MSTIREIIYLIMDEVKLSSDDSKFNEDHILFLLSKYRHWLLTRKYANTKNSISKSNFQTIYLELNNINNEHCLEDVLKSTVKIPHISTIINPKIYTKDIFDDRIAFVDAHRFKFIGFNKYMVNIIYACLNKENYLYIKSKNPNYRYLENISIYAIFEDFIGAIELDANRDVNCDILDSIFPLEDQLIPELIQRIVQELIGAKFRPADNINNASDDAAKIANFVRQNIKSDLAKQMTS